jgi:hypothetical protein
MSLRPLGLLGEPPQVTPWCLTPVLADNTLIGESVSDTWRNVRVTDQTRRVTGEFVVALFRSAVWDLQLAPGVEAGALLEHVGRHRLPALALDARQAIALTRFG